jgi:hypothetical protein
MWYSDLQHWVIILLVGADVLKETAASDFVCTLKTETVISSETLVATYQVTTRCCNSESYSMNILNYTH